MRYLEIISEALIALPPALLANIRHSVFKRILWRMRDAAANDEIYKPEILMNQVKECEKKYDITLPETPCEPLNKDKVDIIQLPFNVGDLPDHYPATRRKGKEVLTIRLEWASGYQQQESGNIAAAAYDDENHQLIFYLSKANPKDIPHRNGLLDLIADLDRNIKHELRHGIQVAVLGDQSKQIAMKKNYATDIAGYFTSPIEFDPTLGSEIDIFVEYYKKHPTKNLSNAIRSFVGMPMVADPNSKPTLILGRSSLPSSAFFHYLKINSPKRYKIAVRKFILGVKKEIMAEEKQR